MATKKTEEVKPAEEETVEVKTRNAWDETKSVRVPRKQKGDYFYVCVNDRRFEIPADGKTVELPLPVAEILEQTLEAEYAAEDYAANLPNRG